MCGSAPSRVCCCVLCPRVRVSVRAPVPVQTVRTPYRYRYTPSWSSTTHWTMDAIISSTMSLPENPPPFWVAAAVMASQAAITGFLFWAVASIAAYCWSDRIRDDFPSFFGRAQQVAALSPRPLEEVTRKDLSFSSGDTGVVAAVVVMSPRATEQCYAILGRVPLKKLAFFTGRRRATVAAEGYDLVAVTGGGGGDGGGTRWTGISLAEPHPPFDKAFAKTYLESWLLKLVVNGTLPWKEGGLPLEIMA